MKSHRPFEEQRRSILRALSYGPQTTSAIAWLIGRNSDHTRRLLVKLGPLVKRAPIEDACGPLGPRYGNTWALTARAEAWLLRDAAILSPYEAKRARKAA